MRSEIWTAIAALGAVLTLAGCTTTYVGQKLDPDGKLTKPGGVPFVLTKPEYTVAVTADAGDATKPVYTLTVQYVPDATQRFTVALDPALFVNGKLDLDLGSSGNLTGAAATTSTRVIDTFGSLVGLALKAQSTGLLDAGSTLSAYKAAVKSTDDPGCPSVSSSIDEFEQEAGREVGTQMNAKRLQAEWVGERLHYIDQSQRNCMTAVVAKSIKEKQEDLSEGIYKKALEASEAVAKDNAELALLNRQIKAEVAALNEDGLSKIADGLNGKPVPFTLAQSAARAGEQFVRLRLAGRFARSLADMSPDVWRARHLAYLERKIAQCAGEALLPGSASACGQGPKIAERVAALKSDWARTLGESGLVERVARIDVLLSDVRTTPAAAPGRLGAVEEHVKLREERDRLQARIDQLRSDLIGKNKVVALAPAAPKASKVEPRPNVPVTLVKAAYVTAVNAKPADYKDAALPEFVLVLEPDNAAAVSALPTPEGGKK
ncbi:MAG: hypothetical protein IPN37_18205 [Betaproteobacteria bacterium]|jgi:cell division protein FtsB|nr:hypothetical protein [Betaproteobacteria bacterium]MBK7518460.1 hypothetical protein [Betaproteobacteria bacterium]MBK7616270.1 hypothetical protein [Burkholderiales bacterium]MBK8104028.1 hypothetical protein [Betaproteobacteria bacterium]MBK8865851.1 hypothetical protein [Betaproteobacteria bacterium]